MPNHPQAPKNEIGVENIKPNSGIQSKSIANFRKKLYQRSQKKDQSHINKTMDQHPRRESSQQRKRIEDSFINGYGGTSSTVNKSAF